jgi:dTDP-4-dehydrorhamnose 3,5-epimerase
MKKKIKLHKAIIKYNKNGNIIKIINKDIFNKDWKFGELYLSNVKFNILKGWHYHKKQTSCLFVLNGKVKFVTYDQVNNKFKSFILDGASNIKKSIIIYPKTWYAFQGLGFKDNFILNLSNSLHSKKYSIKKNIEKFNYRWSNN